VRRIGGSLSDPEHKLILALGRRRTG
jgi:hypothetical protein